METITATELARNSRVIIERGEQPYLVDAVADMPNGAVRVTYSSGDTIEYAADTEVTVL
ncbi:hypothetical protein [Streptomyces sp. MP131-18]|uniref:hypothetical protein n=1 Tax=Streptomyces sp. MP131-18 TaxID=1857892 RepID=UPI0009D4E85E|nr:hypothetical protein [Streptomyces sp. MP131-18]ONK10398.1 hypothetical protein STBA_11200 [Streptomyces sp. MP131-18]